MRELRSRRMSVRTRREGSLKMNSDTSEESEVEKKHPKRRGKVNAVKPEKVSKTTKRRTRSDVQKSIHEKSQGSSCDGDVSDNQSPAINSPEIYEFEEFTESMQLNLSLSPDQSSRKIKKTRTSSVKKTEATRTDENVKGKSGVQRYLANMKSKPMAHAFGEKSRSGRKNTEKIKPSPRSRNDSLIDSGVFSPIELKENSCANVPSSNTKAFGSNISVEDGAPTSTPSILVKSRFKKTDTRKPLKSKCFTESPMLSPVERVPGSEVRGKFVTSLDQDELPSMDFGSPHIEVPYDEVKRAPAVPMFYDDHVSATLDDEGFLTMNKMDTSFADRSLLNISRDLADMESDTETSKTPKKGRKHKNSEDIELFASVPKKRQKRKVEPLAARSKGHRKEKPKVTAAMKKMNEEFESLDSFELHIE